MMSRFQTHNTRRSFVTTGPVPVVHGRPGDRMDCRDGVTGFGGGGMTARFSVDLILSPSKDEGVAGSAFPTSWFDKLTMRSLKAQEITND
ncbi:hypothetical protein WH87_00300 [Devosia epidermidihirudinis]|uniref:Uncharacterized protein n=1 Tax=Devosia epidermidihirudinis TaxID=1293439 RepID=A0A0F5QL52_9HYPH|nr:hypothetical protein WH87_00300 [Devosia epidermidihirudinis]